MVEIIKDLTKKGFKTEFYIYDSFMNIKMSHPDYVLALTAPLFEEETDEEVTATLRRLEEKFYERGWVKRGLF